MPPADTCRLLYVGALLKSKGIFVAAQACRELNRRGRAVHLVIAGEWQIHREAAEFTKRYAAEIENGRITPVGLASEAQKATLFRNAHALLLPTQYPEGQPLVIIEAMSYGALPITTNRGAIPDLLEFPGAELLAQSSHDDANQIADTVMHLMDHPSTYVTLSETCRKHFQENLEFTATVDRLIEVMYAAASSAW
jgi:glycosyltransferase involved in cell wall biosynthesis